MSERPSQRVSWDRRKSTLGALVLVATLAAALPFGLTRLRSDDAAADPTAEIATPREALKDDRLDEAAWLGLHEVREGWFEVDRRWTRWAEENPDWFTTGAAISQPTRWGQPYGFRIDALKEGAPLARLGFQPGDVIVSVNNHSALTIKGVQRLTAELRYRQTIRIGIERDRGRTTLRYAIVDEVARPK